MTILFETYDISVTDSHSVPKGTESRFLSSRVRNNDSSE